MSDESWVDDLDFPKTEAALTKLIDTAENTIRGIDAALNSAETQARPELTQMLLAAKSKAQGCLENFGQQLAERRRLMDDESIEG
jgi:hypothetical protein